MSSSDAQMKAEIARLAATIDQHKFALAARGSQPPHRRSNTYINPNYKPASRPTTTAIIDRSNLVPHSSSSTRVSSASAPVKEVVINGVAFQSSGRSLVRKDLPITKSESFDTPGTVFTATSGLSSAKPTRKPTMNDPPSYARNSGQLLPTRRVYKPKPTSRSRNMTLMNSRRPYQSKRLPTKRKYLNRPCPRFSTTGTCNRGQTCMYQHDPSKIAVCWNFLQGNCSNTAENCNLSHDPTPERTPLCLHFLNKGRCTRENCPFPHVNVGARHGVCRDFAVLGFCEKGLDCDKQHVRECPDFAEKGECSTKGCKLPHVIRANRNRKTQTTLASASAIHSTNMATPTLNNVQHDHSESSLSSRNHAQGFSGGISAKLQPGNHPVADSKLGDEYISLTFNESDSEEESEEEEEENDEDEEDEEQDGDQDENEERVDNGNEEQIDDTDDNAMAPRSL